MVRKNFAKVFRKLGKNFAEMYELQKPGQETLGKKIEKVFENFQKN